MISSLSSTRALSFPSRFAFSDTNNNNTSNSLVVIPTHPKILTLRYFSPLNNATLSMVRHRPAARLGPAEDVSASESVTTSVDTTDEEALRAQMLADWAKARSYKETGAIYEGKIEGFNSGGLLIKFYSLIGFLPYTLLNQAPFCKDVPKPILQRGKDLVGSPISVKVASVSEEKRSLVFSEKEASWSRYITEVEVGSVYDGLVASVADYGAFVHIRFPDGVYRLTGLVHISEASWDMVQDMRNLYAEGDEVKVKVIDIDSEKKRMSLSIKQLESDPLYTTLDKVISESGDISAVSDAIIEPLPGLDSICEELLKEDGITDVQLGRQGLEKKVVSQDMELWLSNAPVKDNKFTLLARAGRQVQEVYLTSTLDQDGIKKAVQHILERVP